MHIHTQTCQNYPSDLDKKLTKKKTKIKVPTTDHKITHYIINIFPDKDNLD